jgi:hypothetical protein
LISTATNNQRCDGRWRNARRRISGHKLSQTDIDAPPLRDITTGSLDGEAMIELINAIYRGYCLARLGEMRKL